MPKGVVRDKLKENYIVDVEEMWSAIIHGRRFPPSSPSLPPSTQLCSIPYLLFSSRTGMGLPEPGLSHVHRVFRGPQMLGAHIISNKL